MNQQQFCSDARQEAPTYSSLYSDPQILGTKRLVAFDLSAALMRLNSDSAPPLASTTENSVSILCFSRASTKLSTLL